MVPDAALEQAYLRAGRMLSQFSDPGRIAERLDMVVALKPRSEDYAAAFQPDSVEIARAGYSVLWKQPPIWPIALDQTALRLVVCSSDELGPYTGRAQSFPRGYQSIAQHLLPDRIWCAWEFLRPSAQDGISFDGLVVFDDHFAWFPKPWRVLPSAPKT